MSYLFNGCFHVKVERPVGATSLHTTHMAAFQEDLKIFKNRYRKIRKKKMRPTRGSSGKQFKARLCAWHYFIPLYFTFKKTNYAQYGNFYLESMKYIDVNYSGLKEMVAQTGLSMQGQD